MAATLQTAISNISSCVQIEEIKTVFVALRDKPFPEPMTKFSDAYLRHKVSVYSEY